MCGKNTRDRQCVRKNARNRQCVRKIYSGSSMCTEKMLGIVNVKWENARNRQCKVGKCSEIVNAR